MINKYDNMIRKKIEETFDLIIPVGIVVALVSAIAIYFSPVPKKFVIIDIIISFILLIIISLKKRISTEIKAMVTISMPIIVGVLSFVDGGFNSSGIILILLSNLISVLLLTKVKSIIVSLFSSGLFIVLWINAKLYNKGWVIHVRDAEWIIHFVVFLLVLITMQGLVATIRKYIHSNIEMIEKSAEITYKIAYYDELTGVPNQKLFKKQLAERASNGVEQGYIIFYNLKNLNLINSIYGETIGNKVLVQWANIFSDIKKESKLLARTSGNEFAIWIEKVSEKELMEWLHYMNKVFKNSFLVQNMDKEVEFYISYACYDKRDINIEECYQRASIALTYAKKNNKSGFIEYDKSFEEIIRNDEEIKKLLQNALASEEFEMYYQKKVDARTNEIYGVEALARWILPVGGRIGPNIFIPMIERMDKSIVFGEIIVKKIFTDYKRLCIKYGKEIKVSINISPSHLMSPGFVSYLSEMIDVYEIKGENIIIEITEEVIIEGIDKVNEILKKIHELGMRISIDDFGTGYSSFSYLIKLDVDELKIDKSFIDQLGENDKINTLLEGIIYIAKGLDFNLIAEGVETREQCVNLVQLGCFIIQGYHFSKPEALDRN
ncbi:bifunctional diguanylate cyclase/phosphodiesterase [Clostridium grantii]|uniref:Diguanylate cyclase (GGDEF) domain-containing protein n=1 Tax=Clostridium grantii DSM 8605 TaxID=1121316 RepID=A0A1M5VWX0_9CLOT|nr:bifunctional diguanylate cyclase/phosphodiesterase [Clostridium grantii]SHH79443.1 diguanylate cyclase (GGDEF) domain-containing protein [Clostridium grantii DSM 8605]